MLYGVIHKGLEMSLLGIGPLLTIAGVVCRAILIVLEWPTGSVLLLPSPGRELASLVGGEKSDTQEGEG